MRDVEENKKVQERERETPPRPTRGRRTNRNGYKREKKYVSCVISLNILSDTKVCVREKREREREREREMSTKESGSKDTDWMDFPPMYTYV